MNKAEQTSQQRNPIALDLVDAAAMLGVSPSTLNRLRVAGQVPYARFGRLVRYRLSDLEAYAAERVEASAK